MVTLGRRPESTSGEPTMAFISALSTCGPVGRSGLREASICNQAPRGRAVLSSGRFRSARRAESSDEQGADSSVRAGSSPSDGDEGQTLYGAAVFALTMLIFLVGLAATFSRNFLPGGLAPPASL